MYDAGRPGLERHLCRQQCVARTNRTDADGYITTASRPGARRTGPLRAHWARLRTDLEAHGLHKDGVAAHPGGATIAGHGLRGWSPPSRRRGDADGIGAGAHIRCSMKTDPICTRRTELGAGRGNGGADDDAGRRPGAHRDDWPWRTGPRRRRGPRRPPRSPTSSVEEHSPPDSCSGSCSSWSGSTMPDLLARVSHLHGSTATVGA